MTHQIELPRLGESVEEGTILEWLVAVGDVVEVDQPLVEISTDKVDTEIPSPVAGTVRELRGDVDELVQVGDVIAVIGQGDADPDTAPDGGDGPGEATPAAAPPSSRTDAPAAVGGRSNGSSSGGLLASPLVRRLLRDADVDPGQVRGTGPGGRVTRDDAERAVQEHQGAPASDETASDTQPSGTPPTTASGAPPVAAAPAGAPPAPSGRTSGGTDRPPAGTNQVEFDGARETTEPISRVRRAIAEGMRRSLDTSAQLTAVVEIDMTRVMNLRAAAKDAFRQREGVSLSPLPFILRAVAMTLPRHPVLNSTLDMEAGEATYKRNINLGMAVDTERGLLVPNIKDAQDLTIRGLARAVADLADRTRRRKVTPDEITGGTFTVTNTGSLGTLLDTPIINPPEVAILGAAAVEKRPVVVSDGHGDAIAIRWMTYACLSYDHRALDGADAARFLQDLRWVLEHHDFSGEL